MEDDSDEDPARLTAQEPQTRRTTPAVVSSLPPRRRPSKTTSKIAVQLGKFRRRLTEVQYMQNRMITGGEGSARHVNEYVDGLGADGAKVHRKSLQETVSTLKEMTSALRSKEIAVSPHTAQAKAVAAAATALDNFLTQQYQTDRHYQELMGDILKFATTVLPVVG